jgi:hypothetical protein
MVPPAPLTIAPLIMYKQIVTQLDEPQTATTNFVTVTMSLNFRELFPNYAFVRTSKYMLSLRDFVLLFLIT